FEFFQLESLLVLGDLHVGGNQESGFLVLFAFWPRPEYDDFPLRESDVSQIAGDRVFTTGNGSGLGRRAGRFSEQTLYRDRQGPALAVPYFIDQSDPLAGFEIGYFTFVPANHDTSVRIQ